MRTLKPETIAAPFARYSHGVELPPGQRVVRVSGQLGLAANGTVPASTLEQARICFGNIAAILAEADMGAKDVFHLSAFVTDRLHMAEYMQARDSFLQEVDGDHLPSSTLLIVSGFTRPEFNVEIEAWAAAE